MELPVYQGTSTTTGTQVQLVNRMPYFELRVVYLTPAVTHYQEGVQLFKVQHIIKPKKEECRKVHILFHQ